MICRRIVIVAFLFILPVFGESANLEAAAVEIRPVDTGDSSGTIVLSIDGVQQCKLELNGAAQSRNACTVQIPDGARQLTLTGEYQGKKKWRGTQQFELIDLAPLLRPLRDTGKPFGKRVREFFAAGETLRKGKPDFAGPGLQPAEPAPISAVEAARKRLGFDLPLQHVQLLTDVGPFEIGDSSFDSAESLGIAYENMIRLWGEPADRMARLSPQTRDLYKSSMILFTEVGDGYGGLLYQPADRSPCQGRPAFYFVRSEWEMDDPQILKNKQGGCKTYEETMIWLFATQALLYYEDLPAGYMLIDRSSKTPLPLELSYDSWLDPPAFTMTPVWNEFE